MVASKNKIACFTFLLFIVSFVKNTFAQQNLCEDALAFDQLTALFKATSETSINQLLDRNCFDFVEEVEDFGQKKVYERRYSVMDYSDNTRYNFNEFIVIRKGKVSSYQSGENAQATKLLMQIKATTIFHDSIPYLSDRYMLIQVDKQFKYEIRNVPDEKAGYIYMFYYSPVTPLELKSFANAVAKDDFPKTNTEKVKLKYRYAEIDSYASTEGIVLTQGDKVKMEAWGEISFGQWAGSAGPLGMDGYGYYSIDSKFSHGALLYKIGSSEWQPTGAEKEFVADRTGRVQFMVNDKDASNNSGSFHVKFSILPKN